jgi:hypothetical protein
MLTVSARRRGNHIEKSEIASFHSPTYRRQVLNFLSGPVFLLSFDLFIICITGKENAYHLDSWI